MKLILQIHNSYMNTFQLAPHQNSKPTIIEKSRTGTDTKTWQQFFLKLATRFKVPIMSQILRKPCPKWRKTSIDSRKLTFVLKGGVGRKLWTEYRGYINTGSELTTRFFHQILICMSIIQNYSHIWEHIKISKDRNN